MDNRFCHRMYRDGECLLRRIQTFLMAAALATTSLVFLADGPAAAEDPPGISRGAYYAYDECTRVGQWYVETGTWKWFTCSHITPDGNWSSSYWFLYVG